MRSVLCIILACALAGCAAPAKPDRWEKADMTSYRRDHYECAMDGVRAGGFRNDPQWFGTGTVSSPRLNNKVLRECMLARGYEFAGE